MAKGGQTCLTRNQPSSFPKYGRKQPKRAPSVLRGEEGSDVSGESHRWTDEEVESRAMTLQDYLAPGLLRPQDRASFAAERWMGPPAIRATRPALFNGALFYGRSSRHVYAPPPQNQMHHPDVDAHYHATIFHLPRTFTHRVLR